MAFDITPNTVTLMRELSRKIPDSVERLETANLEVIRCYEDVKETVGPHTQEIESIVKEINRMLKQSSDCINEIPGRLNSLADRCEEVLRMRPSQDL